MHVHVAVQVQHQWYLMVELEELSVIALVCLKMISPGEMEVVPWRGRGENAADKVGKWENQLKYETLLPNLDN